VNNFFKETHDMNNVNDDDNQWNIAEKARHFFKDKLVKITLPNFKYVAYRGYAKQYYDPSFLKKQNTTENFVFYCKENVVASFGPDRPSPFNENKDDGGIIVFRPGFNPAKPATIEALKKWCKGNWSLLAPNSSWKIGFFNHISTSWGTCLEIAGGGITYDELFDIAEKVRDYFEKPVTLTLYKNKGRWWVGFDKIEDDEEWHNVERL
jgi:hypothetical protein